MWVQVLEKGNGYTVYKVKGMELQETSCHSLEATKVDEIMAGAFERRGCVNAYPAHTLTPVAQVKGIQMYSSAKSSLTGVIEAPDTLKQALFLDDFREPFLPPLTDIFKRPQFREYFSSVKNGALKFIF